ncbi:MAG: hypothetical protein ACLQIB_11945 [Isosphaeraceae bacterium]
MPSRPAGAELLAVNGQVCRIGSHDYRLAGWKSAYYDLNISSITVGASNTILFGEKAQGKFSQTNNRGGNALDYGRFGFRADPYSVNPVQITLGVNQAS